MLDLSRSQVNADYVSLIYGAVQLWALDDRETPIDRIPIECRGKRTRDDSFDAEPHDCRNRLLSSAAAAKIASGDEDVELLEFLRKAVAQNFKRMLGEFRRIN